MELVQRDRETSAVWALAYLKVAASEGHGFLNDVQYDHAVDQFESLAFEMDPTHPKSAIDVKAHGDFYEMRDKGGVLRKINLRAYFILVDKPNKTLIVIGAYKKEDEDQTPKHIVIKMKNRAKYVKSLLLGS